jgi:transcriptional regulator with XRE-family HTH domain
MQALKYGRFHHPDPHVQRKMEALWLKSQKLSHNDICRLTGISPNTLRGYLRAYLKGGIEALKELKFYKHQRLWCIARLNIGVPITLVLDNARYQKCKIVWELAESLNIELLYLPPYSPNLNLIERLWKFVKKQCLYSKYYSEFKDFKNAITDCLNQTDTTHKQELDSLLTLRFQRFEKAQSVAV